MAYNTIGSTIKFYKGLQETIDKISRKDYKKKFKDLMERCNGFSEQEIKLICYLEFAKVIIWTYCANEQDLIEEYESMYDVLQNCLKTKPNKYYEYIQKYPVIYHFMKAVETCKENNQE